MIVTMQRSTSIAANSTNDNVLTGQKYERPPFPAMGDLYHTGSAVGLKAALNVGGAAITDTVDVGARNTVPVVPDDLMTGGWGVMQGLLIQLSVENTTGGALTYFWRVDLEKVQIQGQ